MTIKGEVTSLISGLQKQNPRLHQAISVLSDTISKLHDELHPQLSPTGDTPDVSFNDQLLPPPYLYITSTGANLKLEWSDGIPSYYFDANNIVRIGVFQYEIRKGDDWTTATFVTRTPGLSATLEPIEAGEHIYLIKSMSHDRVYSSGTTGGFVTVLAPAAPIITPHIIDNNILLYWTNDTSAPPLPSIPNGGPMINMVRFYVDRYIIRRAGVQLAIVKATFATFFEFLAGTYEYSIATVDIAGNEGPEAEVLLTLRLPPDYDLQDTFVSTLNGTRSSLLLRPGPKLLGPWTSETYHAHFIGRGYTTWALKLAAYPPYLAPALTSGASYIETIDYGVALTDIVVTSFYNCIALTDPDLVTVVIKYATSLDNVTYSAYTAGASQFFTTFRYLRVKLEFSGSAVAFCEISDLTINIEVKRENDGGSIAALLTDVGGTEVLFTKSFKDVESITVSVESTTEPFITIFDFVDIPNPVSFFVYVFDTTGNRVSKTVKWKARGIV